MDYREPLVPNAPEPLCEGNGPYRPNVAALMVSQTPSGPHLLLGERFDMPGAWQWPQGGIDPGETPEICLFREVEEEIGVSEFEILYRFPFLLRYRFPQRLGKKFHPRIGQEQHYFITALKPNARPDLTRATTPEFRKLRWVPLRRAGEAFVWFKRPVCEAALAHVLEVLPKLSVPMSPDMAP